MNILSWEHIAEKDSAEDALGGGGKSVSLTVGVFDGVHIGHQALLRETVSRPDSLPAAVTFRNNPAILLEPEGYGGDIQTHLQKMDTLAGMGVGLIILIDFSSDFSKLTGRQFFDILMDRLSLSFIVLGSDFVCGYRGDTSAYDIRTLMKPKGIPVAIIPPILYGGLPVSSTRIREAVRKGDMSSAKAMLGRNYSLDMRGVVSGEEEGEAVIARGAILQAVPDKGEYPVIIQGGDERVHGSIRVADGWVRYKPRIRQAMQIYFL